MAQIHVRRALLFMPGDDRRKIEKGAGLGVDSVIMDLEDGVALNNKAVARAVIAAALREVDFGRTERLVRTNPVSSDWFDDDLNQTIAGRPDGYVIPKIELGLQVQDADHRLAEAEHKRGWPNGSISLLALVETARGIANLGEIADSSPRLSALIFGAEDLAGDMGAVRTPEGWEIFYARSAVVLHAKAAGLQAIDTVYVRLDDVPGLTAETLQIVGMGFTGKLAIHPRQVEPIQQAFTPTTEEIQRARRLIDAHNAQQQAGKGAFELDGKMVDMPMIRAAKAVLARARAAGLAID